MSESDLGRQLVEECYNEVDVARCARGRWPLSRANDMAWNAGLHAGWMVQNGLFVQSPPELRPGQRENLWIGTGESPSALVKAAIAEWLQRTPHADVLLAEDIGRIGIGIYLREIFERHRHFVVLVARTGRHDQA